MVCGITGHKVGDLGCKALPVETIKAFKGYQHPLSNHFPCCLNVYEHEFKSLEHAYFWHMATEFGQPQLATDIKNCIHAGEAKKLSKLIATDDERFTWESNNIEVMKNILQAKANQCEQYFVLVYLRIKVQHWPRLHLAGYGEQAILRILLSIHLQVSVAINTNASQ